MTKTAWEPQVARRFIESRINQDTAAYARFAGRVVDGSLVAPGNTPYPFIEMLLVSSTPLYFNGTQPIWADQLWQLLVYNRTHDTNVMAQDVATMRAALHGKSGTLTGAWYSSGDVWSLEDKGAVIAPQPRESDEVWMAEGFNCRLYVTGAVTA